MTGYSKPCEVAGEAELGRVKEYIGRFAAHSLGGTETGAVLDDALGTSGKMIRPRLMLLSSALGPDREERFERICMLAAMVELTHTASLIHDDIVDEAEIRRGQISIQKKYGKDAAVYAGDFLISRVNYHLAKEKLFAAGAILSETVEKMCLGEIGQAACRYREDVTPEKYLDNIRGKTAALFRTACYLGASEAGCPEAEAMALGQLGEYIGIMFQFRDDLMDFMSTEALQGKDTQKDFREGIYTLPVLLSAESEEGRKALLPFMKKSREGTLSEEDIAQMTEVVLNFGTEKAKKEIHRYAGLAYELTEPYKDSAPMAQIRKLIGKLDAI